MQLNTLYTEIKKKLTSESIEIPQLEAKRLIQAVTKISATEFITSQNKEITQAHVAQINNYLNRRVAGEPLSKILGVREFWGLEFIVNEHTLDPRPDTETLIEAVLDWIKDRKNDPLKILDLGTGTGCIPISLLSELPNATAVVIDLSDKALEIAVQNAQKHKMSNRMTFIQGSWFASVGKINFDIIISNPPYIPESDVSNLSIEVKNHDPILALSGGKDGLDDYKKIISGLKNRLNGKNRAFLEIGIEQLESLARLVDESNLLLCDSRADLLGIPRVVEISCGDK